MSGNAKQSWRQRLMIENPIILEHVTVCYRGGNQTSPLRSVLLYKVYFWLKKYFIGAQRSIFVGWITFATEKTFSFFLRKFGWTKFSFFEILAPVKAKNGQIYPKKCSNKLDSHLCQLSELEMTFYFWVVRCKLLL